MDQHIQRYGYLLPLVLASMLSGAMLLVRIDRSGQIGYIFLLWNLFLAWLPLIFSLMVYRYRQHGVLAGIFTLLWLLFLPNAPYLITDVMHMNYLTGAPRWYDAMMLFTFAFTGVKLGFASIRLMQSLIEQRMNQLWGWLFSLSVLALSGFGIYLGRVLRWNSWDFFTNPVKLSADLLRIVYVPQMREQSLQITLLMSAILILGYLMLTLRAEPVHWERLSEK